jgi:N-glycosylase/DNA lyase
MAVVTRRFTIVPPVPFRLAQVVRTHGWVELAPWRWEAGVLARRERIGDGDGELAIRQPAPARVVVTWRGDGDTAPARRAVLAAVGRALSWDWDHAPFCALAAALDPAAGALVADGGGRLLRGTAFYEDFVKTVCTINTSWAGTIAMTGRLVETVGRGVFPTPRQILRAGEARLRERCRLGFRAPFVIAATRQLLADGAIDAAGHGAADALDYDYLLSLKGIGPYAAAHCRVLLHDFSRLPVDTVLMAHGRDALGLTELAAIEAHFERWGDYRFLGFRLPRILARDAD